MHRQAEGVIEPGPGASWGPGWDEEKIIALFEPMVLEPRRARLLEVIGRRMTSVTLAMDAPHDPHNGAAILRSCDAFGVQTVHVVVRAERFLAASTVAKGSERWVDVVIHSSPAAAIAALQGYEICATHPEGELLPEDLAQIPRLCLLLGNEHDGIREELWRAASRTVRIPMRGFVESLNVSVSAAILLAAATRGRSGDLAPSEQRRLYARGLFQSVARAADILAAATP